MNGIQHNGRNRKFEEAYPGCLGRMANVFELNIGVSANRLLNDRSHRDGSPASRRISPFGDQIESELKNGKSNGTPMKMLIAQEMSKEVDSRHDPPNLVARLMGLEALPRQEPGPAIQRSHSGSYPQSHSDIPMSYWEQQNGFFHHVDPNEYKDLYEMWQQSQKSPHQRGYKETTNDKRMALVHQKFIEAKCLSMDEKLRQSKQFQDALEVLSSNKDLILKCLQEPNSAFSHHLYNRQSVTTPPETKRITVLRPSRMVASNGFAGVGNKYGKQMKKGAFFHLNGLEKIHPRSSPPSSLKYYENPTQPTQIVFLKSSSGKPHDVKAVGSPQSEQQRLSHSGDFFWDVEDDENQESREAAKAITQQMRERLGRHCRDETLISSVFSNGYVGDESSSNKSEIEHVYGNLTDSEVMSPVSRHSWDYVNRLHSPYSPSFSRASYSPESPVCREAKKRLSERWAMMASNGSCQEQRHVCRSSSTLGEMLSLSETKKAASTGAEGSSSEEPKDSNFLLVSEQRKENMDNAPKNLMRSKSVPISCAVLGNGLSIGNSVSDKGKPEPSKENSKAGSVTSSFKGKVSSFFSSRNKKLGKDKSLVSETKDEVHSFPGDICSDITESLSNKGSNHASPGLLEPSSKASSSYLIGMENMISPKTGKPIASGNLGENLDQPSPISVLDPSFEEDEHTGNVFPLHVKCVQHGAELPLNSVESNLIDKSPPIGSIARTLSWDDSCVNTASSDPDEISLTTQETDEEEQEWFCFVKTLLSVAGLEGEVHLNSFLARWHSPESPLDPSLRDKYIDLKDEETLHEAKRRQKRSIGKLVFDCVNAALVDIAGYGSASFQGALPCFGANNCISENASSTMVDKVWARINLWFSGEIRCVSDDCGDNNSLVVERVVKKEMAGKGWNDRFRLEMEYLGKDIGGKLVEELVQEAVVELTGIIV